MYVLMGYEVKEGVKRSTGKPYYIEILHLEGKPLETSPTSYGVPCETVVFNLLYSGNEPKLPSLGSKIRVYYGRSGYPEDYDIV